MARFSRGKDGLKTVRMAVICSIVQTSSSIERIKLQHLINFPELLGTNLLIKIHMGQQKTKERRGWKGTEFHIR